MNDSEKLHSSNSNSGKKVNNLGTSIGPKTKPSPPPSSHLPVRDENLILHPISKKEKKELLEKLKFIQAICEGSICPLNDFKLQEEGFKIKDQIRSKIIRDKLSNSEREMKRIYLEEILPELLANNPELDRKNLRFENLSEDQLKQLKIKLDKRKAEIEAQKQALIEAKSFIAANRPKGSSNSTFSINDIFCLEPKMALSITSQQVATFKTSDPEKLARVLFDVLSDRYKERDKDFNVILGKCCIELAEKIVKMRDSDLKKAIEKTDAFEKIFKDLLEIYPFAKNHVLAIRLKLIEPFTDRSSIEKLMVEFTKDEHKKSEKLQAVSAG